MDRFHPFYGPRIAHHVWPGILGWLIPLLVLLVIAGLVVWVVLRLTRHPQPTPVASGWAPPMGPRPGDPALELARSRYARGEISRDDFFLISADLGAPPAAGMPWGPSGASPSAPPAASDAPRDPPASASVMPETPPEPESPS